LLSNVKVTMGCLCWTLAFIDVFDVVELRGVIAWLSPHAQVSSSISFLCYSSWLVRDSSINLPHGKACTIWRWQSIANLATSASCHFLIDRFDKFVFSIHISLNIIRILLCQRLLQVTVPLCIVRVNSHTVPKC
jgi:hypothetical protein